MNYNFAPGQRVRRAARFALHHANYFHFKIALYSATVLGLLAPGPAAVSALRAPLLNAKETTKSKTSHRVLNLFARRTSSDAADEDGWRAQPLSREQETTSKMNFLHRRGAAGKVHEPEAAGNAKPHSASEEDQDARVKPHGASDEDTKDARINQMRAGDADVSDASDDDYADGTFVCAGFFCLLIGAGLVGLMIFCYLKHRDAVWERVEDVDRREGLGLLAEREESQKNKKSRNTAIEEAFYLMRASEGSAGRRRGEGSGAEEEEVLEFENGASSRTSSRRSDPNASSFANSAQPQKLAGGLNMTASDSDDGRAGSKTSSAASQVQGSSSSSSGEDSDS